MTFEELLEEITHDYLNPPTSPDNKLDADKNWASMMSCCRVSRAV